METAHNWLIRTLADHHVEYDLIHHPPEGRTEHASRLRGHPVEHAAKSLVLRARTSQRARLYVLAVVPGNRRVDLAKVKEFVDARNIGFADAHVTESLTRAVSGAVLPFALDPSVRLLADVNLLASPRLWFNAGRHDVSVALATNDYRRVAAPAITEITGPPTDCHAAKLPAAEGATVPASTGPPNP